MQVWKEGRWRQLEKGRVQVKREEKILRKLIEVEKGGS